ncbi:MAG: hypothetical protein HN981_02770 [Candidatus Pacebacteria bacterium]|jgi:hypothetical protein|nr:hypothetical protein [Candidatus Paceibacterota bacterium]MBT4652586.1 hypothetical protein [Candidatus Paceibacterota bacterium]MBT6756413.1 hypothetical protein [Candidatus Paceibacterota bacterium]MBT6921293.1 hypothetical protein [Candidatus Paceibacterota bacterium]
MSEKKEYDSNDTRPAWQQLNDERPEKQVDPLTPEQTQKAETSFAEVVAQSVIKQLKK